jgi:hypothetical protein
MNATTARRNTDTIGVTHTVRVSCNCETCATNAEHLGKTSPLVAYITTSAATMLKITAKNADSPRKVHAIVELANHPSLGPAQRAALAG